LVLVHISLTLTNEIVAQHCSGNFRQVLNLHIPGSCLFLTYGYINK
jgi:hypothetical protein